MIIIDTETTSLMGMSALPTEQQPRMIEWAGLKVDDRTLEETGRWSGFINPGVPIPPEVTRITGISDHQVKDAKKFAGVLPAITELFLGERIVVAHNASFDLAVLETELHRVGRVTQFPWPPVRYCTVELTSHLALPDRKLTTLHTHLFGLKPQQTHRAMDDVLLLLKVVRKLRTMEVL